MNETNVLDGDLKELLEIGKEEFIEDCSLSPNLLKQIAERYAGGINFTDAMNLIDAVYYLALYQGYRIGIDESETDPKK